jgi:predicted transcriptional regulator
MSRYRKTVALSCIAVRQAMRSLGLDKRELARRSGIPYSTICKLLNGTHDCTGRQRASKIANALQLSITDVTRPLSRRELNRIFKGDDVPF